MCIRWTFDTTVMEDGMTQKDVVKALIDEQGTLYSESMGADISKNTPQELFHWLEGAIMLSARIGSHQAEKAGRALRDAGFHRIGDLRERERGSLVRILNEHGYARYDESTANYLRDTAEWAEETYHGDLRKLREEAGTREEILKALQGAKGIGQMGAEIFAREAQLVWDELYPADVSGPAERGARDLGLPTDADRLADLAGSRERYVRLLAALTRAALDGPADKVKEAAE